MAIRKCPHGIEVGPLDDYGVSEDTPVQSSYCDQCMGSRLDRIEAQYLTDDQIQQLLYGVQYVRMRVRNRDQTLECNLMLRLGVLRRRGKIDVKKMATRAEPLLVAASTEAGFALHDLGSICFMHGSEVATVTGDELRKAHAERQK